MLDEEVSCHVCVLVTILSSLGYQYSLNHVLLFLTPKSKGKTIQGKQVVNQTTVKQNLENGRRLRAASSFWGKGESSMRSFVSGVSRTSNDRHSTAASLVVTVLAANLYADS